MVDILYAGKLEKCFLKEREAVKEWGERAKRTLQRHQELRAADNVAQLWNLPGNWHPLHENRAGQFAASVSANYRMIMEPSDDPPALLSDGGIDWANVRTVRIVAIEDYHGR